jgi:hypothetical protein
MTSRSADRDPGNLLGSPLMPSEASHPKRGFGGRGYSVGIASPATGEPRRVWSASTIRSINLPKDIEGSQVRVASPRCRETAGGGSLVPAQSGTPRRVAQMQAVYYRAPGGSEPVDALHRAPTRRSEAGGARQPDRAPEHTAPKRSAASLPLELAARGGVARAALPLRLRALSGALPPLQEPVRAPAHVPQGHRPGTRGRAADRPAALGGFQGAHGCAAAETATRRRPRRTLSRPGWQLRYLSILVSYGRSRRRT